MKPVLLAIAPTAAFALIGCAGLPSGSGMPGTHATSVNSAHVTLAPASGSPVRGELRLVSMDDGSIHVAGEIHGLPPSSTHGFHIHEKGDCSAIDASSAGGHFNPYGSVHGKTGLAPNHAGDSDNITADAQGVAKVDAHVANVTLGGGAANDVAGRAIVVHAMADDYTSQPAGNSGPRVACGTIEIAMIAP